jgi:hypothetical protein
VSIDGDDSIPLTRAQLADLKPDVILLGGLVGGVMPGAAERAAFVESLVSDAVLAEAPAIRDRRLHWLDVAAYGSRVRSHRVLEAVADVHRLLYPAN